MASLPSSLPPSLPPSLLPYLLREQPISEVIQPTHQDEVARGEDEAEKPEAPEGGVDDQGLGKEAGREGGREG